MSSYLLVDARGLRCPINWAKAKVALESMPQGGILRLLVDDPRSERDLPAAAEAEGHVVLSARWEADVLEIVIEK